MRDVSIVSVIYCALFIVLTTPSDIAYFGLSVETVKGLHYFFAESIFWAAALYICASGTMGAFARQDRFSLSQNYPIESSSQLQMQSCPVVTKGLYLILHNDL